MIKAIMLHITAQLEIDAIKIYVTIYHMIKLIMSRIYLKRSSNK